MGLAQLLYLLPIATATVATPVATLRNKTTQTAIENFTTTTPITATIPTAALALMKQEVAPPAFPGKMYLLP